MFQRDYILRMIEMMGDLMRRVRELMDELAQMRLLEEACRRHCGLPLRTVEELSADSLIDMLAPTPRLYAAELLYVRATSFSAMPLEEERTLKRKCLRLLTSLEEEGPLCELRAARAQALKLEVLDLLTPEELMACAAFLRQGGAYADMEDAIFEAAQRCAPQEREACAAAGAAMLREAARAPARELALGRTSAHELRLSARELEAAQGAAEQAQEGKETR